MNNLNLAGTPREMGFQYGKYFAEQGVNLSSTLPPGTKERKEYTESVKSLYKSDYPAILNVSRETFKISSLRLIKSLCQKS